MLPILLFVGAAIAVGLAREPNFEAQARLGIARVDVATPGALTAYATASQSLAEAYSRALGADEVLAAIARKTGISRSRINDRVAASPVPGTPVFNVTATADSESAAISLANTASDELINYITQLNRSTSSSEVLLTRLRAISRTLQNAVVEREAAKRAFDETGSAAARRRLVDARAAEQVSQTQLEAVQTAYSTAAQNSATNSLVQLLARASEATSDRRSKLQLAGVAGLIAGVLAGAALALLLGARAARRAFG